VGGYLLLCNVHAKGSRQWARNERIMVQGRRGCDGNNKQVLAETTRRKEFFPLIKTLQVCIKPRQSIKEKKLVGILDLTPSERRGEKNQDGQQGLCPKKRRSEEAGGGLST